MHEPSDESVVVAKTLSERVILLMARRGMTKGELAEVADVHRNTLSNIINDRLVDEPTDETIRKLASALGVVPEVLYPTGGSSGAVERARERVGRAKPKDSDGRNEENDPDSATG